MADHAHTAPLPGMEMLKDMPATISGPGYIERALLQQISRQQEAGELDDRHLGRCAVALVAARKADQLREGEKAYGVAQVLAAVKACLELLPEAVVAQSDRTFQSIVDSIKTDAPQLPPASSVTPTAGTLPGAGAQ